LSKWQILQSRGLLLIVENCSARRYIVTLLYGAGVLYFVSTTVNPILYNVLSRKYRAAFTMTLCQACMDDATRLRLQRDGFRATMRSCSVYQSQRQCSTAARVSSNQPHASDFSADVTIDTESKGRHRNMWGNAGRATHQSGNNNDK